LVIIAVSLVLAVLLFRTQFRIAVVIGDSMLPSLAQGDLLLVNKCAYRKTEPLRGDVVVARNRGTFIVKRIVGLPGEEVEVRKGALFVNDAPKPEDYSTVPGTMDIEKGKLLSGDFATLGDNRSIPPALAIHPILTKAEMLGKVVFSLATHSNSKQVVARELH
jgi:signal peptidase I